MPKEFSFTDTYETAKKEYNLGEGTDRFKPEEGENKFRLVSVCLPHAGVYKDKPTFKWLCHILDRKDGKVKPYFMPVTVYKGIEALQLNDDYKFDNVPMPYDINLKADGAGTKEVKYTVMPSKEKALTKEELKMIEDAPDIQEIQDKIKEKQGEAETPPTPAEPTGAVTDQDVSDIPL